MKKSERFQQFRIDVIKDTVFISSRSFDFVFTPVPDTLKEEFRDQYRYFGGLQCDYDINAPEYKQLEKWLCQLAESTLDTLNNLQ